MHPDSEEIQITDNYLSRGMTDGDAVWSDMKLFTDKILWIYPDISSSATSKSKKFRHPVVFFTPSKLTRSHNMMHPFMTFLDIPPIQPASWYMYDISWYLNNCWMEYSKNSLK